jgi:glycosyltransferase involved in cell wall biosynthesis
LCLAAVKAQTYPAKEVIVVDDGSTDDSVAVAEAAGVRVIRLASNGGSATARNAGAAEASGDLLFFLDSDVALAPDALAQTVAAFKADPGAGAICGVYEAEPLVGNSLIEQYRCLVAHYWRISSLGVVTFLFSSMCGVPSAVFAEVGPFNPALKQTEEVDWGQRLSERYRLLLTDRIRGRHDDDNELLPLMRKLYRRGRLRVPLYVRRRRFARGFETASRAYGSLAALAALVTLPLVVLGVGWLAVPLALEIVSIVCDAGMYRFVMRKRGPLFLGFFAGAHFLVNVAIAAGVGIGVLQWLVSGRFRALYDRPAVAGVTLARSDAG